MPLRAAWYGTALLLAFLTFSGGAADQWAGVWVSQRISAGTAGGMSRISAVPSGTDRMGDVLLPAPGPLSREVARRVRHPEQVATAVERRVDVATLTLPLFVRITPFANPECAAAAARSRAGACSSFATTQPPPLRA